MRVRVAPRWVLLAIVPLLIAASDPDGDVGGCSGGAGTGAPDLVEARGEIIELGTSARWELTFARPLTVPDAAGHPFRVDIAIRDPDVPAFSFAYYRNVNRLVRVDATVAHGTEIYLLPEHATNVFNPPAIDARTMVVQVPGRTLTADEKLTGTSPGLASLRWTVLVRDERACDFLGDGRPNYRLTLEASVQQDLRPAGTPFGAWIAVGAAGALAVGLLVVYRSRRAR